MTTTKIAALTALANSIADDKQDTMGAMRAAQATRLHNLMAYKCQAELNRLEVEISDDGRVDVWKLRSAMSAARYTPENAIRLKGELARCGFID